MARFAIFHSDEPHDTTRRKVSKDFPIRSESHQLEEQSERFFRNALPTNWTCERPSPDYGVDLRVDIFEGNAATGLELLVQLKATNTASAGRSEIVRLGTATYNHLVGKLQVAMLVVFVADEAEAYWVLFKDVPTPSQESATFSIHVPKDNRLSSIDWDSIQKHVRAVTDHKLSSMRRQEIERKG
jgi:hypothetical protein